MHICMDELMAVLQMVPFIGAELTRIASTGRNWFQSLRSHRW